MALNRYKDGHSGDYTNATAADIKSGDVVVCGNTIYVALVDIAIGATGSVAESGVWLLPKVPGAVMKKGEIAIWDLSAKQFDDSLATTAAGDIKGAVIVDEDRGNGTTSVPVKIGFPGTIGT